MSTVEMFERAREILTKLAARGGRIARVATHKASHPDERVALWMMRYFDASRAIFPGVASAEIIFTDGEEKLEGKNWEEHLTSATPTVLLGTGGPGPFNEHVAGGMSDREEDDACTTRMARFLGIENDPALKRLLDYILKNDQQGHRDSALDVATFVRAGNLYSPLSEWERLYLLFHELDDFYASHKSYAECEAELYEKGTIDTFEYKGKRRILVAIESKNPEMASFAMSKDGVEASVVIVKSPAGNVAIIGSRGKWQKREMIEEPIDLKWAAAFLRQAEANLGKHEIADRRGLTMGGTHPEVPEWYLAHQMRNGLFNGSFTHKVTPTKISLEKITKLVTTALTKT